MIGPTALDEYLCQSREIVGVVVSLSVSSKYNRKERALLYCILSPTQIIVVNDHPLILTVTFLA